MTLLHALIWLTGYALVGLLIARWVHPRRIRGLDALNRDLEGAPAWDDNLPHTPPRALRREYVAQGIEDLQDLLDAAALPPEEPPAAA